MLAAMKELRLFNRDGNGAKELIGSIGMIGHGISFDVWEPIIPLGVRDVAGIIGWEPIEKLSEFYQNGCKPDEKDFPASCVIPLHRLQQAVAYFTWIKIIPTLDAGHDTNGRSKRLGENERGMTALQEFKDEENVKRLAYEYVDLLVESLDRGLYDWWTNSERYRLREGLLVRSKETFDMYYMTGSHRLFVTLLPIMREVQGVSIAPVLGEYLGKLLANEKEIVNKLFDSAARALVLLTMKKAVERLPVEVIPEGIVQVQQSQPIKQRLKAEKEAREAVALSLGNDGEKQLERLASLIAELEANDDLDGTVMGPIVHSKGLTY